MCQYAKCFHFSYTDIFFKSYPQDLLVVLCPGPRGLCSSLLCTSWPPACVPTCLAPPSCFPSLSENVLLKGSVFTNVCSMVLCAISIILIGFTSPRAHLSSEPGVGGTKVHDFQYGSNQFPFYLCLSILWAAFLHSFDIYIGRSPARSYCISQSKTLLFQPIQVLMLITVNEVPPTV